MVFDFEKEKSFICILLWIKVLVIPNRANSWSVTHDAEPLFKKVLKEKRIFVTNILTTDIILKYRIELNVDLK